jgi:hypothetical protein
LDEFLVVAPDLITIYLGWNRTIARADPKNNLNLYRPFALYKIYYHFIVNPKHTGLQENYVTKPGSKYFDHCVHPAIDGYALMGKYFGEGLKKYIAANHK